MDLDLQLYNLCYFVTSCVPRHCLLLTQLIRSFRFAYFLKFPVFFEYVFSVNAVYHNKCQLAISILYLLRNAVICRVVITKCHVLDNLNLCSYSPSVGSVEDKYL